MEKEGEGIGEDGRKKLSSKTGLNEICDLPTSTFSCSLMLLY